MNTLKRISFIAILLSALFSFSAFAMTDITFKEPTKSEPSKETIKEDGRPSNIWTWISDDLCIQYHGSDREISRKTLQNRYNDGAVRCWYEDVRKPKKRDTYIGTWSQAEDGTWLFEFDDQTIPIELTKIDGVLYAFNGYGELKEGIIYYGEQKTPFDTDGCLMTGADGVVTSTDPEFLKWMETQYIPECSTHKEEAEETATE